MKQIIALGLISLALSSCASQQALNSVLADCTEPDGTIIATCAKKHANFSKLDPAGQRIISYRVMLNEQVDAKKLTQAQADVMFQEYKAKIANEAQAINNANSQASSNAMMNTGAALMMMDAANRPRQTNTSCSTFMGTMNCRSY